MISIVTCSVPRSCIFPQGGDRRWWVERCLYVVKPAGPFDPPSKGAQSVLRQSAFRRSSSRSAGKVKLRAAYGKRSTQPRVCKREGDAKRSPDGLARSPGAADTSVGLRSRGAPGLPGLSRMAFSSRTVIWAVDFGLAALEARRGAKLTSFAAKNP